MDKSTVRLKAANISDIGRNPARTKNEDYYGHYEGEYGNLFLVCDGMGGHEAGEVASRLAVESIKNYFSTNYLPGEEAAIIGQSIDFAQQKLLEAVQNAPDLSSMGTTLVLLLINGSNFWYAHSGDSRIYLSRGGSLIQLTRDHSEVQRMVDSGIITKEQAAEHPRRNFITKAIGHTDYQPEIEGPRILQQDDVFLLCTDGLTEYVKDDELLQQMEEEPSIACRNLVEMANDRGGSDNITIQIVRVLQCSPFTVNQAVPASPRKKILPPLGVIATLLVFIGAVIWYTKSMDVRSTGVKPKTEQKAKKPKKEKPGDKDKKSQAAPAQQSQEILKAIDAELGAKTEGPDYQTWKNIFAKLSGNKGTLKFIGNTKGDQVAYVLPGPTVYLAFYKLRDNPGYMKRQDQIDAFLALAVLKASQASALGADWKEKLFASGNGSLDDNSYNAAWELYKKYDPANADVVFGRKDVFAAFKPLIKIGSNNLSITGTPER